VAESLLAPDYENGVNRTKQPNTAPLRGMLRNVCNLYSSGLYCSQGESTRRPQSVYASHWTPDCPLVEKSDGYED
jgi:hypothetical protein